MRDARNVPSAGFSHGGGAARHAAWRRPALLAATASLALAIGLLVYITDRSASHAGLLPRIAALAGSHVFGALGQWLPSFVHPLAFSLFTVAALPPSRAPRYGACLAWGAVNVAFEIGQHPLVSARLAELLQGSSGGEPITQALARYFVHGTFDPGDIVAALLGTLAAGAVLRATAGNAENKHAN